MCKMFGIVEIFCLNYFAHIYRARKYGIEVERNLKHGGHSSLLLMLIQTCSPSNLKAAIYFSAFTHFL